MKETQEVLELIQLFLNDILIKKMKGWPPTL